MNTQLKTKLDSNKLAKQSIPQKPARVICDCDHDSADYRTHSFRCAWRQCMVNWIMSRIQQGQRFVRDFKLPHSGTSSGVSAW